MRKLIRGEEPPVLKENAARWNNHWMQRRRENHGAKWRWPEVEGDPVNRWLLPDLKLQTAGHCSFCDGYPVAATSTETIEHFYPKSDPVWHHLAFAWENLFFACTSCQGAKSDRFDPLTLKPDEADYSFDRFFRWDSTNGRLEVNLRAAAGDQSRARVTIAAYGLNALERPRARFRQRILWNNRAADELALDEFPYRDYLTADES